MAMSDSVDGGGGNASSAVPDASGSGGNAVVQDLFTQVPVDLFRMGNASGPKLTEENIRLEHMVEEGASWDVRLVDVALPSGETVQMVPVEGGMSTFDGKNPRLKGQWWKIPAGTRLPDTIQVGKDETDRRSGITHYSLRPTRMTLLVYAEGLKELAKSAQKEPKMIITEQIERKEGRK
jgi:hypothetical protein